MNHGSLYSGIGGWLLAARWAGIENIFTVEIDEFCNKVLKKHFNVEQYRDIKEFDGTKYRGAIDIISTSDPCQPFSFAGKRGGTTDDRYLWPQTVRVIREIRPSYVVFENVPGFISMAFEIVASDLEGEGYTVESFIIPACAVGAWHRRDRLWIIAYNEGKIPDDVSNTNSQGLPKRTCGEFRSIRKEKKASQGSELSRTLTATETKAVSNTEFDIRESGREDGGMGRCKELDAETRMEYWSVEPGICRVAHGIPNRVDRLKSLGNSIIPQIAYIIFEAIKAHESNN